MKIRLLIGSLLLSAISSVSSSAQPSFPASPDSLVRLSTHPNAQTGMTRDELVEQLGQPSEKLSASIWLYFDLRAKGRPTGDQSDTLVVVFTHDRISLLRLTERSLIAPAIAKVRSNGSNGMAVARK